MKTSTSTHRRRANYLFRRALWIDGDGRYAVAAHCNGTTVTLHADPNDAARWLDTIDRLACGGHCYRDHALIDLGDRP